MLLSFRPEGIVNRQEWKTFNAPRSYAMDNILFRMHYTPFARIYVWARMCACVRVHVCVCMCACMRVHTRKYIFLYVYNRDCNARRYYFSNTAIFNLTATCVKTIYSKTMTTSKCYNIMLLYVTPRCTELEEKDKHKNKLYLYQSLNNVDTNWVTNA